MSSEENQPTVSSMEVPDEQGKEKKKRQKQVKSALIGSKQQVWDGVAEITGGKLKKIDLMECPKTKRIISKKKHASGLALMERAKKAKEDPSDPLHEKFVSFFEHQYKKKTKEAVAVEGEKEVPKEKKKRGRKIKVKDIADLLPEEASSTQQ
jgi:hypothetical protein